jgi:hypothetical protein
LENCFKEDLTTLELIEWFRKQNNERKNFTIILENFEQITKPEVINKVKSFIFELIDETEFMKIMVFTKQKEFKKLMGVKCWFKRIDWKPLSNQELARIMLIMLKEKGKQRLSFIKDIRDL